MKTHIKMQNINSGEPKTKLRVNFASFSDKCNECEKQAIRGGYLGEHERADHADCKSGGPNVGCTAIKILRF